MSNRSITIIALILVSIFSLIGTGLLLNATYSSKNKIANRQSLTPTPTPQAQVTLALSPNPLNISSQSASVDVTLDTQTNRVTALQLELLYDPKSLTDVDIIPGTFIPSAITFLKNIDKGKGRISYTIGLPPTTKAVQGKGTVATITFRSVLSPTQKTEITFLPQTLVTAEGVNTSVLKTSSGTTIIFTSQ